MSRRRIGFIVVSVGVLVALNALVWQNESQLSRGQRLYLSLQDDSSPQAGDETVQLRYEIAAPIDRRRSEGAVGGTAVVALDDRNVARFVRPYSGESLDDHEHVLRWRHNRWITIGPKQCRVEDPEDGRLEDAAYVEFVVSESGVPMLVGLRDSDLNPIEIGCGIE